MKIGSLLLLAAPAVISAPPQNAPPQNGASPPAARLPGFAAALSEQPVIAGPDAWRHVPHAEAWAALAAAKPDTRQATRWSYARSLIAGGLGTDALGVLDVMKADDPDLALVPSWQIARGAALVQTGRPRDALAALAEERLTLNPEACLWRMRGMAEAGLAPQALAQVNCALPAIQARPASRRAPFVVAAARAAVEAGRPALALQWLRLVPDRDPAANLYRGRAYLALGETQAGRLRLDRVTLSGDPEQRIDAKLSVLEADVNAGRLSAAGALPRLDKIRFAWRGGEVEARALRLTAKLGADAHDLRRSLAAGATLFRYFDLGRDAGATVAGLQTQLGAALAPDSGLPLDQAAGLYWDYRDLAPSGAEGDLLVTHLAGRLQAAGLYRRAAELLQYQLTQRARDVAQGPLSVKVASLYILAGRPDLALRTLRDTDGNAYPDAMLWDRRRVGAAALNLLGKTAEALALLQDVPDSGRIRAEIFWKKGDWANLIAADAPALPGPGTLSDVEQAVVLRHAIALAMLGREDGLAQLRTRYIAAFAGLPTGTTFDVLTRAVGSVDPAMVSKAMAALPGASPAGPIGDLLDAGTAPAG